MAKKTGLILGSGALYGAYGAGAASVLGREIHFDHVYGCSVGVFAGTLLITNQFDLMLDLWRNYIHGKKLINLANPIKGRNILDLEYVLDLFKGSGFFLNLNKLSEERDRLTYVLTHCGSDEPEYFCPDRNNVFDGMIASLAVPFFRSPVKIKENYFYDGAFSDPYPLQKALDDGNETVIVVSNFSTNDHSKPPLILAPLVAKAVRKCDEGMELVEKSCLTNQNIILLRPSTKIIRSILDRNKERINKTIDQGIKGAEEFLFKFGGLFKRA